MGQIFRDLDAGIVKYYLVTFDIIIISSKPVLKALQIHLRKLAHTYTKMVGMRKYSNPLPLVLDDNPFMGSETNEWIGYGVDCIILSSFCQWLCQRLIRKLSHGNIILT